MRKHLVTIIAGLLLAPPAIAEVLTTEQLPGFTDRIMVKVGQGDLDGAFVAIKPYLIIPPSELEVLRLSTMSQREMVAGRFGKTVGYECLPKELRGQYVARITCIERTEKHALPWRFYFYLTPTGWVLNTFIWNDNLPSLFPAN